MLIDVNKEGGGVKTKLTLAQLDVLHLQTHVTCRAQLKIIPVEDLQR